MKQLSLLLVIIIVCHSIIISQNSSLAQRTLESFEVYQNDVHNEKVYLQTDKTVYKTNETIWFSVYLLDGINQIPMSNSIVYVELISTDNNQIIGTRNIKIEEGIGKGDILIPNAIFEGKYLLRAYSRNMQNFDTEYFFHKVLFVKSSTKIAHKNSIENNNSNLIDIQFFPEGGNLINGLACVVAFKATDSVGKPINIEGTVVDNKDRNVCSFLTLHAGMGKFTLKPEPSKQYKAIITHNNKEQTFDLPKSLKQGYQMTIRNTLETYNISIESSLKGEMDSCFVIAQSHNDIIAIYEKKSQEENFFLKVNKNELPEGIIHFTFFDNNGTPWCERLVYNFANTSKSVAIKLDTSVYGTRKKVKLSFESIDSLDYSSFRNISLSVSRKELSNSKNGNLNIQNYALLSSDLIGNIDNPGYYFDTLNKDRQQKLDLLLMTQGWRRFKWQDILQDNSMTQQFEMEDGFNISGQLVNYNNKNVPFKGKVTMNTIEDPLKTVTLNTDDQGRFMYRGVDIMDTVNFIFNAEKKRRNQDGNSRKAPIFIKVDSVNAALNASYIDNYIKSFKEFEYKGDTVFIVDPTNTLIKEVDVYGVKIEKRKNQIYSKNNVRYELIADSITNFWAFPNLFDYLKGRFPDIIVSGIPYKENIKIRARNTFYAPIGQEGALIVIDGIPFSDNNILYEINCNQIESVDILSSIGASVFGVRGSFGVVSIHTKPIETQHGVIDERMDWSVINFEHPGYYQAREFYSPIYDGNESNEILDDYRTTLFWSPALKIDTNCIEPIEFYTSDEQAEYVIQLEGITKAGEPILGVASFDTQY